MSLSHFSHLPIAFSLLPISPSAYCLQPIAQGFTFPVCFSKVKGEGRNGNLDQLEVMGFIEVI
jgi:hypothetical protein